MLGFGDLGVTAAFVLTLASAALCVVYGLLHWNDDDAPLPPPVHPPGEAELDDL
ncbi:conserved hypothetical protein [Anaeromyxobacter dehalogenans 2CP-1]|jgi:hypothetical protein|uniref:Uncharacterized protein n=1 Tax=Anaeromyxobacter dehalogenans (strain ATCC BAA-258 / DSM 21875 / 2CP-1) TaxID=455488 RepID=B8J7R8_ANAD2|nr:symporter small accessory protein [Anaeromyxobacter dehalogenans]ACL63410.1 conserved hypothetical protein [Anaeromyxobacter dehalogenans 2CP-1]